MQEIELSLIVAMTPDRLIGKGDDLPWSIPSDMKHFVAITKAAGTVIVGNKTFRSILKRNMGKPLKDRVHIVLTRNGSEWTSNEGPLVEFVRSIEEACAAVAKSGGRACIIGGSEVYRLFLPRPELVRAYVTTVHARKDGDVYFPDAGPDVDIDWRCIGSSKTDSWDSRDAHATSHLVYERIQVQDATAVA